VVGTATALLAASIGLFQNDIKKVLAYSTVSQLGYMFVALGLGSYSAAMFHVTTHAFFKALLFLGAGSVIHAWAANRTSARWAAEGHIKITYITFLIGTARHRRAALAQRLLQQGPHPGAFAFQRSR
jgi:NADH-quinone oxidoreductase subunit L